MVTLVFINSCGKNVSMRFTDEKKARKFARALTAKGIKLVSFARM